MKAKDTILYFFFVVFFVGLSSCNDFLDKTPADTFTDEDFWTDKNTLRMFTWKFYSDFIGYGSGTGTASEFYFQSSSATACINISDDLANNTYIQYQTNPQTNNSDWKNFYITIRRANLLLARVDQTPGLLEDEANHWKGVARFFRAFTYFKLVQRFGDVPYSEMYVQPNDVPNIYLPRTNRNKVMDKVKEDLEAAINLLREQDQVNTINKNTALALLSRICLYEGTYRKYHTLGDGTEFLKRAKSAANTIIESNKYRLNPTFQSVYNSIDLGTSKEMILYLSYQPNIYMHSVQAYTNTSTLIGGMTKAALDSYTCTDGLPITQSELYKGDESYEAVLSNRDKRLIAALHPKGWGYIGKENSEGLASSTGYIIALFNNPAIPRNDVTVTGRNHIDAPIFGLAEVMLNYAEATAELGELTQADLEKSINLLRERAGITKLTYLSTDRIKAGDVYIEDPKRTSALEQKTGMVSPIIWEIRRDRRAELMTWTYMRYYDLMRWKKGQYLDTEENKDVGLGARVGESNKGQTTVNQDGYIITYPGRKREFNPEKHYFNAIPINDINLYKNEGIELTQNPKW